MPDYVGSKKLPVTPVVAIAALVGCAALAWLVIASRGEVNALREAVLKLKNPTKSPAPATTPAVPSRGNAVAAPRVAASAKGTSRIKDLEATVAELRKSIDRIGRALGDLAGSGDRRLAADGADPLDAMLSADPAKQESFRKAVSTALRKNWRERRRRWSERRAKRAASYVKKVAEKQGWDEAKTQQVSQIVSDLRQSLRRTVRQAYRGSQTPSEAQQSLSGLVTGARDQLVTLLGASDYEAFRQDFNQQSQAWRRLRQQRRNVSLPPAR